MGFRNRGPKRRWGWGGGSLAEYCGGWGETQREESFVANKFRGHTPSQGLGKEPRKKLGVSLSLRVLYPSLAGLLSLPLYIDLQTCLAWLALIAVLNSHGGKPWKNSAEASRISSGQGVIIHLLIMHLCKCIFCDLVVFQVYRGRTQELTAWS